MHAAACLMVVGKYKQMDVMLVELKQNFLSKRKLVRFSLDLSGIHLEKFPIKSCLKRLHYNSGS